MPVESIQAIDVHAHFGEYWREQGSRLVNLWLSADAEEVVRRAARTNVCLTVVSPLAGLLPRFHGDPVAANPLASRIVSQTKGVLQWVIVDPLKPETFRQAEELLPLPHCVGIKIHPEEHGYAIREQGDAIFEFAAQHQAVVVTHSGEANSMPEDFVPFADEFPSARLILAHLGCTCDGDPSHQVRAIQRSRQGNIYVDTSSAQSLMPGLIEWAVQEIGAERILLGSDSPLYSISMQRSRIDKAEISDDDKRLILRDNAARLLGLENLLGAQDDHR